MKDAFSPNGGPFSHLLAHSLVATQLTAGVQDGDLDLALASGGGGGSGRQPTGRAPALHPVAVSRRDGVTARDLSGLRATASLAPSGQVERALPPALIRDLLESSEPVITSHDHSTLWQHAAQVSGDVNFALSYARGMRLQDAGVLGYVLRASSTLGEACRALATLSKVFDFVEAEPDANVDVSPSADLHDGPEGAEAVRGCARLVWSHEAQDDIGIALWSEFCTAVLVRGLRDASGMDFVPQRICFRHASAERASLVRGAGGGAHGVAHGAAIDAFGLRPSYGGRSNVIAIAQADLDLPLRHGDPVLMSLLMDYCTLLKRAGSGAFGSLAVAVERTILDGMSRGEASLAHVATGLGMSQRTLSRKLSAEGTSFFAILESVRRAQALRYLSETSKPLSEISFLLGYASLSSFNDAFRRWTGGSPGTYRQNNTNS